MDTADQIKSMETLKAKELIKNISIDGNTIFKLWKHKNKIIFK